MWNYVKKWTKTSSDLISCTASVVFVRGNKLYIEHVGDSSIVIGEASISSEDTAQIDQPSTIIIGQTPQRPKLVVQRKEHILTSISNGLTPVRTPKRPASDDITEMLNNTPLQDILPPVRSTNNEEDDQEFLPLTKQIPKISIFDDDLARKVEECFRNNTNEQQSDIDMMEIDQINNNKEKSSRRCRCRSRFRFSFSNNHHSPQQEHEQNSKRKSRLCRTHSASIINHEDQHKITSSHRRKSYSTIGLANELKNLPNNNNEQATSLDKKSTKTKSSLANRVKRAFS
ncbi:unnamed protein product [Rotaria sp. Silwood2]|nr:unnamed protein product [Rotaria sp. Silwood2]